MGVKLGRWHWGRNVGWGCLRIGCWGEYLGEVTREWRKLHNEELSDLYSLPNIVRVVKLRRMRWAGHVARMEEGRDVHRVLVGKPEGKRPLGRPRRRWEDNNKMDLQKAGGGCGDWMELAQDRDRWWALVSTVMNLRVPKLREISWLAAEPISFSRRTLLRGVSKYIRVQEKRRKQICAEKNAWQKNNKAL